MIRCMATLSTFRTTGGYARWLHWTEWLPIGLGLLFLMVRKVEGWHGLRTSSSVKP